MQNNNLNKHFKWMLLGCPLHVWIHTLEQDHQSNAIKIRLADVASLCHVPEKM